ncbi:MAG: Grx4 family monothiol glutaredoxin [bacterium]
MTELETCLSSIATDVKTHKIVLFMKGEKHAPQCGFSAQVVQILHALEVDFETRNVLSDEILREAIKQFSDWPTIPQLYVNAEFIGGCDIVTEQYQNGELETLVKS